MSLDDHFFEVLLSASKLCEGMTGSAGYNYASIIIYFESNSLFRFTFCANKLYNKINNNLIKMTNLPVYLASVSGVLLAWSGDKGNTGIRLSTMGFIFSSIPMFTLVMSLLLILVCKLSSLIGV